MFHTTATRLSPWSLSKGHEHDLSSLVLIISLGTSKWPCRLRLIVWRRFSIGSLEPQPRVQVLGHWQRRHEHDLSSLVLKISLGSPMTLPLVSALQLSSQLSVWHRFVRISGLTRRENLNHSHAFKPLIPGIATSNVMSLLMPSIGNQRYGCV